jgi:2-amino-4-hydroxy-6-hydroxymethyldihydropteridine diphosphokinase
MTNGVSTVEKQGPQAGGPILIGLGANLPSPEHGPPVATLEAALAALERPALRIRARSRWWESAPVPISDQPWYVNGVIEVETGLAPETLLALLHEVEAGFGRLRSVPNAPRILDLDLLAYGTLVREGPAPPLLPHPRMAERAFVLHPLAEIRPGWRHPASGLGLPQLIARLPSDQIVRPLPHSAPSG